VQLRADRRVLGGNDLGRFHLEQHLPGSEPADDPHDVLRLVGEAGDVSRPVRPPDVLLPDPEGTEEGDQSNIEPTFAATLAAHGFLHT